MICPDLCYHDQTKENETKSFRRGQTHLKELGQGFSMDRNRMLVDQQNLNFMQVHQHPELKSYHMFSHQN
jgi:hypothetical protein